MHPQWCCVTARGYPVWASLREMQGGRGALLHVSFDGRDISPAIATLYDDTTVLMHTSLNTSNNITTIILHLIISAAS